MKHFGTARFYGKIVCENLQLVGIELFKSYCTVVRKPLFITLYFNKLPGVAYFKKFLGYALTINQLHSIFNILTYILIINVWFFETELIYSPAWTLGTDHEEKFFCISLFQLLHCCREKEYVTAHHVSETIYKSFITPGTVDFIHHYLHTLLVEKRRKFVVVSFISPVFQNSLIIFTLKSEYQLRRGGFVKKKRQCSGSWHVELFISFGFDCYKKIVHTDRILELVLLDKTIYKLGENLIFVGFYQNQTDFFIFFLLIQD